jgi:hypothetical protein
MSLFEILLLIGVFVIIVLGATATSLLRANVRELRSQRQNL